MLSLMNTVSDWFIVHGIARKISTRYQDGLATSEFRYDSYQANGDIVKLML